MQIFIEVREGRRIERNEQNVCVLKKLFRMLRLLIGDELKMRISIEKIPEIDPRFVSCELQIALINRRLRLERKPSPVLQLLNFSSLRCNVVRQAYIQIKVDRNPPKQAQRKQLNVHFH